MIRCKKVVSLILALTLMFSVFSVGIVQTAAEGDDDVIYTDPPSEPALLGDVDRDGRVTLTDVYVLRNSVAKRSGYLRYANYPESSIEFKVADVFKDYEEGLPEVIDLKDVYLLRAWLAHKAEAQDKGIGEPVYPDPTEPPATNPPATNPPATNPPATNPPATNPPATNPPATNPPATNPPATNPPATIPPATNPPATAAPATKAPETEPPTDKAIVTVRGLDGESETQEFNVGDAFTVYTTLNTSNIGNGKIGSLNGTQYYTNAVLALADEYDPDEGDIIEVEEMFPVTKSETVANGKITSTDEDASLGAIYFNASKASINKAFLFNSDGSYLIISHYTVTAPGTADVDINMTTLAVGDQSLTRIIDKGEIKNPDFRLHSSFYPYGQQPTYVPPTQAPETEPPTGKATVTIYGLNGQSETREFNVGDTFTVYTSLNAEKATGNGSIASLSGTQTYTDGVLQLKNALDEENLFVNSSDSAADAVFPVCGDRAMGRLMQPGEIRYNASTPNISNAFLFDSDDDLMIVTTYTVTAGGTAEVRNALTTLAAADENLTRLVNKGVADPGVELTVNATFDKPQPQAPETQAPATNPPATNPPATNPPATNPPATNPPATNPPATNPPATNPPATNPPATNPPATQAPETEPPTGKATVTVIGLDGAGETREFNVGETFTVYTTLNTSAYENGGIGSLNGTQYYTNSVLALADEYDPDEGDILEVEEMFPVTKGDTVANGMWIVTEEDPTLGAIYFNASKASITRPYRFDANDKILIKSHYTVTAPGEAVVSIQMTTLAIADQTLTRIIDKGEIKLNDFRLHSQFDEPVPGETTAPATNPPATNPPATNPPATNPPATNPPATNPPATNPPATNPPATNPPATQAPETEPPTGKATVTVIGLDGAGETREFNVGETFTVYTTLNTSAYENGGIGSLNGTQYYTNSVLALADEYDPDEGDILEVEEMFPVTKGDTVANGMWTVTEEDPTLGAIYFNASKASITRPYRFDANDKILIKSHYTVTAPGEAVVSIQMTTLAIADQTLTRIIDKGEIKLNDFRLHSQFDEPVPGETTAPATNPPATNPPATNPAATNPPATNPPATNPPATNPPATNPPATNPPATQAPETEPPTGKATVTVIGLDGAGETREFNVGETFTVYTTLNTSAYENGGIGSLNGTQYYTNSVLALADEYDPDEGDILEVEAMFPVTKGDTVANGMWIVTEEDPTLGAIYFNASKASISRPYRFDANDKILIKSHYTVTAPGEAVVSIQMTTLAIADQTLTRIIDKGEIKLNDFRLHSQFDEPVPGETTAPATNPPATNPPATNPPATNPPATNPPATNPPATNPPATNPPATNPPATNPPATNPPATQAPETEPPTGKATVTVIGLDGAGETREFNVGETFTVYTTLNTSAYENGGIGSLNGTQYYTNSVLALADEYDPDEGDILEVEEMFPVTKGDTVANGMWTVTEEDPTLGAIYFNASKASIARPYRFDANDKILIKSHYTVTAPGEAVVSIQMTTLAIADQTLTRIIDKGEIKLNDFRLHSQFDEPVPGETTAPATNPPATNPPATNPPATNPPATNPPATNPPATNPPATNPPATNPPATNPPATNPPATNPPATNPPATNPPATNPPATNPPATQAPETEPPTGKATVTVIGLDGAGETREFNVGDTFTVYTTLNTANIGNGKISSVNGTQYYTNSVLALADAYDPDEGDILDLESMFPVMRSNTVANGMWTVTEEDPTLGAIYFNASTGSIANAFLFNTNASKLIVSHYTVTAPGTAEVKIAMTTLAAGDQVMTRIIDKGDVLLSNFRLHSQFDEPVPGETTAPATNPPATNPPATNPPATNPPATNPPATNPPATEPSVADGYYLVGSMNDWTAQAAYMFSENTGVAGEYKLDTTLSVSDGIKAVKVENGAITTWYPDGMDNEYTVDNAHAGAVTVYFRPAGNSEWNSFGGFIFIPSNVPADTITVKFTNTNNWSTVNIYCWDEDGEEPMGEWPGSAMTQNGNVYSATIPANAEGVIFNDGGTNQTVDITDGIVDGAHWKLSGEKDGNKFKVATVTDTPVDTITVKFTNTNNWSTVNIYCWDEDGEEPMGEWPGSVMTQNGNVYSATIPANVEGVIFNDGGTNQTVDITDGIIDGAHWKLSGEKDGNKFKVAVVTDTPDPTTPSPTTPAPTTPAPTTPAPTDPPVNNNIVFEPGIAGDGSPVWFAWVWMTGQNGQWIKGTIDSSGNVTFAGAAAYDQMCLVRMPTGSTAGNFDTCWNRTGDITIQKNKTLYFTGWGSGNYFNTGWK